MVLHLQHAFCLVSGINSKFVFKITISSSSILQCYLPVLLCKASFWFRFACCWTLRITLHMLHVQFATYKHFSGKLNVFHYQQTITFTQYQALGFHSKNCFQYRVITVILKLRCNQHFQTKKSKYTNIVFSHPHS